MKSKISGGTWSADLNELGLWLAQGIGGGYWLQVSGAANQGPSSFKTADYVPPDISHDIPLRQIKAF